MAGPSSAVAEMRERPEHPGVLIHESAYVDAPTRIGAGTRLWHFVHVLSDCDIGRDCVLGQNVYLAPTVVLGDRHRGQHLRSGARDVPRKNRGAGDGD